jgi:hypothetical protein
MKRWAPSVLDRFHSHASVVASADLPEPDGPRTTRTRLLNLGVGDASSGAEVEPSSETFCWGPSGGVVVESLEDERGGSVQ